MSLSFSSSRTQYGVDVAHKRMDDLDTAMLQYAKSHVGARFLDIGSGAVGQSKRLVAAGAMVQAIDIVDYSREFAAAQTALNVTDARLSFVQGDILCVLDQLPIATYNAVCLQRTLHYVPYSGAQLLLRRLSTIVNGPLYISITGLQSAIGLQYPQKDTPIELRWGTLLEAGADIFSISAPLCLYSQAELSALLDSSGWQIERLWTSAFGNHKAIAKPKV